MQQSSLAEWRHWESVSPTMTLFPVEQVENSDENNSVGEKVFSYSNSRSSQKTQWALAAAKVYWWMWLKSTVLTKRSVSWNLDNILRE